jgi:hypothetical protein
LLSVEQKRIGLKISRDCLEMFEAYPQDFFDRFVTIDETWVYHYASESKQQPKQWKKFGELTPKKQRQFCQLER